MLNRRPLRWFETPLPDTCCAALSMATPSKGKDEQDNPIHFSGDLRDWQAFKQALQSLADRKDYSWLFDTGKALCDFYVSQVRDKTGKASRRKIALAQEINAKPDGNHVPTEVKALSLIHI